MGDFLGHPLDAWGHGYSLNGCAMPNELVNEQCNAITHSGPQWTLRNPGPRGSVGAKTQGSAGLSNTEIPLDLWISLYYVVTNFSS